VDRDRGDSGVSGPDVGWVSELVKWNEGRMEFPIFLIILTFVNMKVVIWCVNMMLSRGRERYQ
jgi:hypothetical protein